MGFIARFAVLLAFATSLQAQDPAQPAGPKPARVELSPKIAQAEVGQRLTFSAAGFDEAGNPINAKPGAWFATPFDIATADEGGNVTFHRAGIVRVGALINGRQGFINVTVQAPPVTRIDIQAPATTIPVGTAIGLQSTARIATGEARTDVQIQWSSLNSNIATIDEAGFVNGITPGKATIQAMSGTAKATVTVDIVRNPVVALSVEPSTAKVRTGDVLKFAVTAKGDKGVAIASPLVRWTVGGDGAMIGADGGFIAEKSGSYSITAISGDRAALATVTVTPRDVARELEVVGRTQQEEFQTAEQWIIGNYAYVSTLMAGRVWVYDISNPGTPLKVDSVAFDARVINDVSTTPDGKIGVITREGASSRKNGIVFLDLSDPAHPKVLSEYTETVTGGVHSAYIDGHYVYATDDATGSLRVIDFADPRKPREVARWQTDNSGGRYLHDVQVVDGLIYMGYWKDGLIILDVGKGIKGGTPENPQLVSQLRFNYGELYGPRWLAGAHSVFRYKNYVFLGDEVFPTEFDLTSKDRIPVKGMVHVVDVSDILNPRSVAEYEVPEAGAHNMWVENDVMYIGYYNGGGRAVDVSGELRGNLYRQGREMTRLWTGTAAGFRPNLPFTWGAQPHRGLIYFNDVNTGVWITRMVDPRDRSGR